MRSDFRTDRRGRRSLQYLFRTLSFYLTKNGHPDWGALAFLAAAAVIVVVPVVVAAHVAAVAEEQDQNDDPPPVVVQAAANTVIIAHKITSALFR